ncbi:glycosyltransferase [Amycolatopsis jejuensis]|uniref:glycosyltransferase n=1 Tax=Amycolatopsis jejuensis TaxID=330084 RepID=UPI0005250F6B|nr:glycosyltransferase [Amycolatopsis jejuensis]
MEPTRRPILFVSSPEAGLLNPLLTLAGELSGRGVEDLWFATDEPRRGEVEGITARTAAGTPVEFASLGEVVPEMSAVTWDDETYRAVTQSSRFKAHRAVLRHTVDPQLRVGKYRALESAADKIRPALMVIESMSLFAVELAITRKIPFILSVPFMPSNVLTSHTPFSKSHTPPGFPVPHSGLPYRMTLAQRIENRLFKLRTLAMFFGPEMAKVVSQDGRIRAELGIAPEARGQMARIDAAESILVYSVPGLDYPFPVPEKMRFVGAMIPPLPQAPEDRRVAEWLDARDSVVYLAFGTITRLTPAEVRSVVEVARRLEGTHQFLWKLPADQQEFLPPAAERPGNLRVESWLPSQLDVLAHPSVKVFFTHAGGNGYHEGLYFGKPLVVRPLWVDCHDQAVRGADFGVSLTLDRPETIDPGDVVDKITKVAGTDSFRARAEYFSRQQREAGGRRAAADVVLASPALQ